MLAACAEPGTAAHLCATLDVNGVRGWFLPSRDELALMYKHLKATGVARLRHRGDRRQLHLLVIVAADDGHGGNHIDFADLGRLHYDDKDFPRRVRAIRMI